MLRLIATGKTNRAIAAELVLSDKTIERYLNYLFAELGVSSRAAAAAYSTSKACCRRICRNLSRRP